MKTLSNNKISPEYPRIPHFNKEISNMTHDDISLDTPVSFPIDCHFQEKIDGSNCRISWNNDGPILGNRSHILKKGYSKIKTPAKIQFKSAWNFVHKHEDDIKEISKLWESPITIFGEYMFASHSIFYDKLPDVFVAYDIYSVEDMKFLSPVIFEKLIRRTSISYIVPHKKIINSINEIVDISEMESDYRSGIREGIVIKTTDGLFCDKSFKVVNKFFKRRDDFNDVDIIKNIII